MKQAALDLPGTLRRCPPEVTLAKVQPLLKKFGITRVANVTGLDNIGIHVTSCIRPNAKHLSVSQGKGLSLEYAMVSAIMESIEGWHAENPPAAMLDGCYRELQAADEVISPQLFLNGQFAKSDIETQPFAWVNARDLINNKSCYLPQILCCIDTSLPRFEYAFFNVNSNGLASGNSIDEAVCHALFELIERDALYHWQMLSHDNRKMTQIDLSTITEASNKMLLAKIAAAGLGIKVWEITSKIGVPAFHCAIFDNSLFRSLNVFTGTGAHISKAIALSRAITEAAQGRLTYISGSRDDVFDDFYRQLRLDSTQNVGDQLKGVKNYADCVQAYFAHDFTVIMAQIIQLLTGHGYHEIFLVDHTKTELGIPVVQIFVPSLKFNGARM